MNIILFDGKPSFIPRSDERARHILSVLRLKEGDVFRAGILGGRALECRIDRIADDGLHVTSVEKEDLSALYPLTLLLAEVRPICMRRILRETVSLGVGRIFLTVTDTGERSYHESGLYRSGEYKDILVDGAMQSGFTGIPEVRFFDSVDAALLALESGRRILLDNVAGSVGLSSLDLSKDGPVTLAVGPERGWSDREREKFFSDGFTPALIGHRILRTETAAVAGVAMTLEAMGLI